MTGKSKATMRNCIKVLFECCTCYSSICTSCAEILFFVPMSVLKLQEVRYIIREICISLSLSLWDSCKNTYFCQKLCLRNGKVEEARVKKTSLIWEKTLGVKSSRGLILTSLPSRGILDKSSCFFSPGASCAWVAEARPNYVRPSHSSPPSQHRSHHHP